MNILVYRTATDLSTIPEHAYVLGIEVPDNSDHKIVARCNAIIDPQHSGGLNHCAAIETWHGREVLLEEMRLADEIYLITPRFDLDAVCAMAILKHDFSIIGQALDERLAAVNYADNFSAGKMKWPGPRPFPTVENPWLQIGGAGEVEVIAAVNWLTGWTFLPPKLSYESVVGAIAYWLQYGETQELSEDVLNLEACAKEAAERDDYPLMLAAARKSAYNARLVAAKALASGDLMPESIAEGRAVFFDMRENKLHTTSSSGIGYCIAPVSGIALFDTRMGINRYSVAAFNPDYFDYHGFIAAANAAENDPLSKWGGNPASCIIGSSMDKAHPTSMFVDKFKELVCKYCKM